MALGEGGANSFGCSTFYESLLSVKIIDYLVILRDICLCFTRWFPFVKPFWDKGFDFVHFHTVLVNRISKKIDNCVEPSSPSFFKLDLMSLTH